MPTARKTPKSKGIAPQLNPVASPNSQSKTGNPISQRGGYVKGWATKGKLPSPWRNRIKEAYMPLEDSLKQSDHYASLKAFMDSHFHPYPHGYKATLEELQNNIHTHPLLIVASAFNPITTDIKNGKGIDPQRLTDLLTVIGGQLDELDDDRQRMNTNYACGYIEDLISMLVSKSSAEEMYIAWYYALAHFKRTGDKYDQYFVNMPSPDERFGGIEIL